MVGEEGTEAAEVVSARFHHPRETGEEVRGRPLEEVMVAMVVTEVVDEVDIDSKARETIEATIIVATPARTAGKM